MGKKTFVIRSPKALVKELDSHVGNFKYVSRNQLINIILTEFVEECEKNPEKKAWEVLKDIQWS